MHLAANKGEAGSELKQEALDMIDQRPLDFPFAPWICCSHEVEEIGILEDLTGQIRVGRRQGGWEVMNCLAVPLMARVSICRHRMGCDQPCRRAASAYHSRDFTSRSRSKRAMFWRHGNCATTRCTISPSGQAAANARIYLRLRGEKPFMSG